MKRDRAIKIIIIVLTVLLALSLVALAAMLIRHRFADSSDAAVTVPDNLITPSVEPTASAAPAPTETEAPTEAATDGRATFAEPSVPPETAVSAAAVTRPTPTAGQTRAATITLYNRQPEDNAAFRVGNMFPGDSETKYFCVRVSYHDKISVHYGARVRSGDDVLAEALRLRVRLLTTGETLYDGSLRDMPESLTHPLASRSSTVDELYYEITAYLDTSVGNECQGKTLLADFSWWVEETGKLDDSPKTGDDTNLLLWTVLAAGAACALIVLLLVRRRKEDDRDA